VTGDQTSKGMGDGCEIVDEFMSFDRWTGLRHRIGVSATGMEGLATYDARCWQDIRTPRKKCTDVPDESEKFDGGIHFAFQNGIFQDRAFQDGDCQSIVYLNPGW
jgi:hypothetical protein